MNDELLKESVAFLAREIRVAAILREAGRLAPDTPTQKSPIHAPQIQKAMQAYKEILVEIKKQGL